MKYLILFMTGIGLAYSFDLRFHRKDQTKTRHCAYTNERYEMPSKYTGHCVCIYDEGYVMLERCEKDKITVKFD